MKKNTKSQILLRMNSAVKDGRKGKNRWLRFFWWMIPENSVASAWRISWLMKKKLDIGAEMELPEEEVMTLNGKEYKVKKLLGKGKGGYSYLVTDGEKEYVLKQIHHEPCSYYQFDNKLEAEKGIINGLWKLELPCQSCLISMKHRNAF